MRNKFFFIFFIIICLMLPKLGYAATLSLLPNTSSVNVGNIVSVKVVVNTQGVAVNNGEAVIEFPTDLLEVVSISKSSSIFSLWVEEPSFSNLNGRVTFNGGAATPGFTGGNGTIASITFKAKKQGTASVIFSDAAVRQNDGLGTNVLSVKSPAVIQIGAPAPVEVPPVVNDISSSVPAKPVITSETHPDQGTWYPQNTASFSWKIPSGTTSVQAILNKTANSVPSITYDSSVTQKTLSDLSDGVFYFHLRYRNSSGWSPVAHYQINVDSTAPLAFSPTVRTEDAENLIKLNAEDATSGISYYLIKIDSQASLKVKKSEIIKEEYVLPVLNQGDHNLVVTAYDKAGNHTESDLEFRSSFISAPTISLSSKEINKGEAVVVFGKTEYPFKQVDITLESNGKIVKKYIQTTTSDGSFSLATEKIKTVGTISISAENVFSETVRSKPSEKVFLKVNEAEIVKVTIAIFWIIILIILLIILLFITYEGWHKFFGLRKKLDKELDNTREEAHKAMLLFKEELNSQLDILEKTKLDRNLNKKEEAIFKEIQKNVDDIDNFLEKKLKKMM